MALTLPEVDDRPLARSPLAVVVFQVKYEQNLSIGDGDTGLRVYEHLGGPDGRYIRVEPIQIVGAALQVSPLGLAQVPSANVPSRGFRMRNEDGTLILSLMPDFAALETTAYGLWKDDFRERLVELISALSENIKPRVEERLGLRYVNKIVEPGISTPADFRGIISDGLLGAAADDYWSAGVTGAQQQLEMDVNGGIRCVLRHGTLARNTGIGLEGYLLDIDVFREQPRRFDIDNIGATIDTLNKAATTIFQRSLNVGYLERLRKESDSS
jgi:uncharacterized protein (TIGR04255 family)